MIRSKPLQGYWVRRGSENSQFMHILCGPNDINGAQCPNCEKPLLRLLSLDASDPRLETYKCPTQYLPLLFCWTCNIAQEYFFYRIAIDHIEIMHYGIGGVVTDFPYESYPKEFPQVMVHLEALSQEEQDIILRLNAGALDSWSIPQKNVAFSVPTHQLGGEPLGYDGDFYPTCRTCGSRMRFFASIGNTIEETMKLTTDDYVQTLFFLCRKCWLICASQQAD